MKGKYFVLLSSILACTTLASIGFATWIITGNSTLHTDENTILVDDVSDKRIGLGYEWETGDGSVIFGYKTDETILNPWLANSNSTTQEKLSNTLKITINNADSLKEEDALNFEFTVIDNSSKGWATAVENNYVGEPEFTPVNRSEITIDDSSKVGTYLLNIEFRWGSVFDNKNPYTYYNKQSYTDSLADDAKAKIGNLKSYIEGVTFKLTITANAA